MRFRSSVPSGAARTLVPTFTTQVWADKHHFVTHQVTSHLVSLSAVGFQSEEVLAEHPTKIVREPTARGVRREHGFLWPKAS